MTFFNFFSVYGSKLCINNCINDFYFTDNESYNVFIIAAYTEMLIRFTTSL